MLRWLGALLFLSTLTGLLASGIIPVREAGLAKILFVVFTPLLAVSLVIALFRKT